MMGDVPRNNTLYHVSPRRLAPGDELRPQGVSTFPSHDAQPYVFLAPSYEDAEEWAGHIGYVTQAPQIYYYEVEAASDMTYEVVDGIGQVRTSSATVKRLVHTETMPDSWD